MKGSDKTFNFCYRGEGERLFVFEAPIDLLSFLCLFKKEWQKQSYLSLGGVSEKALLRFLSDRPNIKTVYLCLDSDKAGTDACSRLNSIIPQGYTVNRLVPLFKDWNEVLQRKEEITDGKYAYGEEALKVATTIKLTRALWIIPMAFATSFIFKSKGQKISIPWFIFFFVLAMVVNTYLLDGVPQLGAAINGIARKTLTITMFFIGASLSLDVLKAVGIKPLLQGVLLWVVISLSTLAYIYFV